ncbi:MAG: transcriptional regulator [Chryseotalea sp. WA131a]|nr:MAG: transcriptional regulator [Chryseotalea sp. WA131a]
MWTILQNKKEYQAALDRLEKLSENPPDVKSDEGRELMLLGYLIDQYEEKEFPIRNPNPIDAIKVRMNDLGLQISDLLDVFGDRGTASKVLSKKRGLSLAMIRSLADRLSLPLNVLIQPTNNLKSYKANSTMASAMEQKAVYQKRKKTTS